MYSGKNSDIDSYFEGLFDFNHRRATTYDKRLDDHTKARELLDSVADAFIQDLTSRAARTEKHRSHAPSSTAYHKIVIPREIWAEIISNITDKGTLLALLLTSRLFNEEAERILYRKLNLDPVTLQYQHDTLRRLSACPHVSQYVRSLEIRVDPDLAELVRRTLEALNNLKYLTLWNSDPGTKLPFVLSGVPFQLHRFTTDDLVDDSLKPFLRSQPDLTILELVGSHHTYGGTFLRSEVPALSALSCEDPIRPEVLVPDSHITNLCYSDEIATPLPHVQVLRTYSRDFATLASLYPNLRFLHITTSNRMSVPLQQFRCLEKFKMQDLSGTLFSIDMAAEGFSKIFNSCQTLKCLEAYWRQHEVPDLATVVRIQERPSSLSTISELVAEICFESYSYHKSEWQTWAC